MPLPVFFIFVERCGYVSCHIHDKAEQLMTFFPYLITLASIFPAAANPPLFTVSLIDDRISKGYDLAIGDVDGDGKPDILMADDGQFVWYRNCDWQRFVLLEHLGERNGASIAARDMDGDGKVEVAISIQGYQTNVSDSSPMGSLYYLICPEDPTKPWFPVLLDRRSAIQEMQWVKTGDRTYQLIALRDDDTSLAADAGQGLLAFEMPDNPVMPWERGYIRHGMPQAHQLEVYDYGDEEVVYVCGSDGGLGFRFEGGRWTVDTARWLVRERPLLEMQIGRVASRNTQVVAAIEPLGTNMVTIYTPSLADSLFRHGNIHRMIIDTKIVGAKGLGMADFMGLGRDQIVVGAQKTDSSHAFGIQFYVPFNPYWEAVDSYWIDRNGIDCENLKIADMDADGKLDIVVSGRSTHNLKIYWNRMGSTTDNGK